MSDSTGLAPELDYTKVQAVPQAEMIKMNNGVTKSGKVRTKATEGKGLIYIPALGLEPLSASWSSIGTYHLDICFKDSEDQKRIMEYSGFKIDNPGTLADLADKGAWEPVAAYLDFNGTLVAGSVNLLLHSGSGKDAKLNVTGGNLCFYSFDSKTSAKVIAPLIQRHRAMAMLTYTMAKILSAILRK
jgi:hypothetical protein